MAYAPIRGLIYSDGRRVKVDETTDVLFSLHPSWGERTRSRRRTHRFEQWANQNDGRNVKKARSGPETVQGGGRRKGFQNHVFEARGKILKTHPSGHWDHCGSSRDSEVRKRGRRKETRSKLRICRPNCYDPLYYVPFRTFK